VVLVETTIKKIRYPESRLLPKQEVGGLFFYSIAGDTLGLLATME
jgi:hypothetical protein